MPPLEVYSAGTRSKTFDRALSLLLLLFEELFDHE